MQYNTRQPRRTPVDFPKLADGEVMVQISTSKPRAFYERSALGRFATGELLRRYQRRRRGHVVTRF
jgi:hypothetical protein